MTKLYTSGEWQLDTDNRVLSRVELESNEQDVPLIHHNETGQAEYEEASPGRQTLEPRVFGLLLYFLENPNRTINRDELIDKVWEGTNVSESAINWTIAQLRKYLEDNQSPRRYIQTLSKKGYQWLMPVESFDAQSEVKILGEKQLAVVDSNRLSQSIWVLGLGLLVTVLILWFVLNSNSSREVEDPKKSFRLTSIALPFTSMTGAESNPAYSPDGNWLAFIHYNSALKQSRVMIKALNENASFVTYDDQNRPQAIPAKSLRQKAAKSVSEAAPFIGSISWAPHSKQLAYMMRDATGCYIKLIAFNQEMRVTKETAIHRCHFDGYTQISWGRSPLELYFSDRLDTGAYKIFKLDLRTQKAEVVTGFDEVKDDVFLFRVSPREDKILYVKNIQSKKSQFVLKDLKSGQDHFLLERGGIYYDVDWDAQGTAFYFNQSQQNLYRFDLENKSIELVYSQSGVEIYGLTESPDQTQFAFVSASTNNNRIDALDLKAEGSKPRIVVDSSFQESMPQFTDNGASIYFVSDRTGIPQVWRRDDQGQESQISNITSFMSIGSMKMSKDGKHLIGESDFSVRTIDFVNQSTWVHNKPGTQAVNPIFINQGKDILYSKLIEDNWQLVIVPYNDNLELGEQVTTDGGFFSAFDGKSTIYFTKKDECGIYTLNLTSRETEQFDKDICVSNNSLIVRGDYLFFEESSKNSRGIFSLSLKDNTKQRLLDRQKYPGSGFSINREMSTLIFHRRLPRQSDIFIIASSK